MILYCRQEKPKMKYIGTLAYFYETKKKHYLRLPSVRHDVKKLYRAHM